MLLSPIFCLNLTILNSFAEKKIFFFILFQIFSANPGFWEYFLRTRFAESTTFSTSDLKGHMLAHSGQYMCQQGCKEYLKTWSELDRHHELIHGELEKV